jgi:hypothetical protein
VQRVALAFLACLAVAALAVLTLDPEQAWAVALFILALGGAAAALVTLIQLRRAATRRRVPRAVALVAGRRGLEAGAAVAILLWLRAVDGLSIVTAAFVVITFVVAEFVLAARPMSSR